jgi:hypothetical protein
MYVQRSTFGWKLGGGDNRAPLPTLKREPPLKHLDFHDKRQQSKVNFFPSWTILRSIIRVSSRLVLPVDTSPWQHH